MQCGVVIAELECSALNDGKICISNQLFLSHQQLPYWLTCHFLTRMLAADFAFLLTADCFRWSLFTVLFGTHLLSLLSYVVIGLLASSVARLLLISCVLVS